ncbi:ribonuclease HII [Patescibacteria group bacterium]|nr:ribonuclease HII [Patescibacteria group bacterium]MBU1970395.1 ribonuclease HII [Patescibacteria group bacterium]
MKTILDFEQALWGRGVDLIAGVDEVGRGPLAGPLVVGAVIFHAQDLHQVYQLLTNNDVKKAENNGKEGSYLQIKDSKLLSAKKRERLSQFIIQEAACYSIYQIDNREIDAQGISACTQQAFTQVVKQLALPPEHILTDAFPIKKFPPSVQTNIKRGDRLSLTIAAASIVAKVFRDKLMCDFDSLPEYGLYGFAKHKGYGTKLHLEKIAAHGLCDLHRRTFVHLH